MMSNSQVRIITHEKENLWELNKDRFEFNPKGKFPWLQKRLFKLLRWMKADSFDKVIKYNTRTIDTSKIVEAIRFNKYDIERLYYKKARYVIMGYDAFTALDGEMREFLRFEAPIRMGMGNRSEIMGLEIIVVPWIEGFFVLPDLEKER
jgi:hypothetical protein